MSRHELLKDIFNTVSHNLYCYSEDTLMTKPKKEYEESWYKEKERLELIEELLEEIIAPLKYILQCAIYMKKEI